jgi:hypothetical protein
VGGVGAPVHRLQATNSLPGSSTGLKRTMRSQCMSLHLRSHNPIPYEVYQTRRSLLVGLDGRDSEDAVSRIDEENLAGNC